MLSRTLAIEIARVTEAAAIAAARFRGRGNEQAADEAAVAAMRTALNEIAGIDGRIVVGEGEAGQVAQLYAGEAVGGGGTVRVDLAVDPLEGTTLCAKAMPNAISCMAIAEAGGLFQAPDIYMSKIAIGPGYPADTVDLDRTPEDNIRRLAEAKGVPAAAITACVLDRPRHADLIAALRAAGAAVRLISDGDIAGIIHVANPRESGIDIYLGTGGAPEGVLAAAALRCMGGHMQGRLVVQREDQWARARKLGIEDVDRKLGLEDLARGEVLFAATGVTDGSMLAGVRFEAGWIETETMVMRSVTRAIRRIATRRPE